MSFIQVPTPITPVPRMVVDGLKRQGAALLTQMNSYATSGIKAIWATNGQPNTVAQAQAMVDIMGVNAASAFAQSEALVSFLSSTAVNCPVASNVLALIGTFTANSDGSVTITAIA